MPLFGFTYWGNRHLLDVASTLSAAEWTASSDITTRDLRATLVHTLDVEWSWRLRLQKRPRAEWGPEVELKPADYPTVAALAEHWARDEAEMRAWLATLDDDKLGRPHNLEPSTAMSTPKERYPLWYFVLHIHTHTHQQLGDAAVLLTRMRHSPGNIEFLDYAEFLHKRAD